MIRGKIRIIQFRQFNKEFWENLKDCKENIEDLDLRGLCYQFKHEENPFGVKQEEETCWSMKSEKRCYYIDKVALKVDDFITNKPIDE